MKGGMKEPKAAQEAKNDVTVHVTGNGVVHVDVLELIRSDKVQKLMDDMDKVFGQGNSPRLG